MRRAFAIAAAVSVAALSTGGCSDEQAPRRATAALPAETVAADDWKAVIGDWYDDAEFDDAHTCVAVRAAIERLPTAPRGSSSVAADVRAYEALVCAGGTGPAGTVEVLHRFDMSRLPYPEGVFYVVTIGRASVPTQTRSWMRSSSDAAYTGHGGVGATRLGSVRLLPGTYIVRGAARPCAQPAGGCRTIGAAQDRCRASFHLAPAQRIRVAVVAVSGQPCAVRISS